MRFLLPLLSLFGLFGSFLELNGQQPSLYGLATRKEGSFDTLEGKGLYPIFVYKGRPHVIADVIGQKERWEGILSSEEVKYLPAWERYRFKTVAAVLLVADADNTVYVAKSNPDGFEPIGYIKKKGLMKRAVGNVWKGLKFAMDGPLHIVLSMFGI